MLTLDFLLILLHLVGASVWVGGHLVLALRILPAALAARDAEPVRAFEGAYARLGLPAFAGQIVTGLWLALRLLPLADWFDPSDPLARAILMKLACLGASLLLALHARLRIIPQLTADTLPVLGWHIRAITAVSILFVLAGASVRVGGLAF